jgi:hypothetical protein
MKLNNNNDEEIYSVIRYNLNKVNNKMLLPDDDKLPVIIQKLTELNYNKIEHFQQLTDILLEKTINELKFSSIYARLCAELFPYYIELDDNKVYFKNILLSKCQNIFSQILSKGPNMEKDKITGITSFISHLYMNSLISSSIVKKCTDDLSAIILQSPNVAEGIACLIILSYKKFMKEDVQVPAYFLNKTNSLLKTPELPLRSQFALQNILDKIGEFTKLHN